jgi:hypothetical protein
LAIHLNTIFPSLSRKTLSNQGTRDYVSRKKSVRMTAAGSPEFTKHQREEPLPEVVFGRNCCDSKQVRKLSSRQANLPPRSGSELAAAIRNGLQLTSGN